MKYNRIQVKEDDDLVKDLNSGAIINTNFSKFEAYKRNKLKERRMEQRIDSIEQKMELMLKLISDLKKGIESNGSTDK